MSDARLVIALIILSALFFAIGALMVRLLWIAFWRLFDYALERYTRWRNQRFECRVGRPYRSH